MNYIQFNEILPQIPLRDEGSSIVVIENDKKANEVN